MNGCQWQAGLHSYSLTFCLDQTPAPKPPDLAKSTLQFQSQAMLAQSESPQTVHRVMCGYCPREWACNFQRSPKGPGHVR